MSKLTHVESDWTKMNQVADFLRLVFSAFVAFWANQMPFSIHYDNSDRYPYDNNITTLYLSINPSSINDILQVGCVQFTVSKHPNSGMSELVPNRV